MNTGVIITISTALSGMTVARVMQRHYATDCAITENTSDCDSINDSITSYADSLVVADITPEVVLQMLENPNNNCFFLKNRQRRRT